MMAGRPKRGNPAGKGFDGLPDDIDELKGVL